MTFAKELSPTSVSNLVKICSGSHSTIYRGEYNGKTVVVKEFRFADAFRREKEFVQMDVQHNNIVKYYGWWEYDEKTQRQFEKVGKTVIVGCIVMEYFEGGDLFDVVKNKNNGKIKDLTFLRKIINELVLALGKLAEVYVIHRDIKPENIFFRADGTAVLGDFDLCSCFDYAVEPLGTTQYAAWEIHRGQPYTIAVDYWSLGCLLYAMYYGYPAFTNKRNVVDRANILRIDIQWRSYAPSDLISFVEGLVCLPEKRMTVATMKEHDFLNPEKTLEKLLGKRKATDALDKFSRS
jgi:serine/threonine protein kinase